MGEAIYVYAQDRPGLPIGHLVPSLMGVQTGGPYAAYVRDRQGNNQKLPGVFETVDDALAEILANLRY